MKEAGTAHWSAPNTGATHTSGLTILPGGCRFGTGGNFGRMGQYGYLWTSTSHTTQDARIREFSCNTQKVNRIYPVKTFGFSIRCVMDN